MLEQQACNISNDPSLGSPVEFWNTTKRWPVVPVADGVEFLAAAMHRIARAYYPDWHSREPWFPIPPADFYPRDLDRRDLANITAARELLRQVGDGIKPRRLTSWESYPAAPVSLKVGEGAVMPLSDQEWEAVFVAVDEVRRFAEASRARWEELVEACFAFLKSKAIDTVLRPRVGGAYVSPPPELWNTELEHVYGRFYYCDVDLDQPFAVDTRQMSDPYRIFVTRDSLDRLVGKLEAMREGRPLLDSLAPATPSTQAATLAERSPFRPRQPGESATTYRKRASLEAISRRFPTMELPADLNEKQLVRELDMALKSIDDQLKPPSLRTWGRYLTER